jgi:hypothetical protein
VRAISHPPTLGVPRHAICPGEHPLWKCSFQARLFHLQAWRLIGLRLRGYFPPAQPCARRDVRFAHTSTDYRCSFQACSLSHLGTARMSLRLRPWREHFPQFHHSIGPACALREHGSDMRVVPTFLVCALGEQGRPTACRPISLRAAIGEHGDYPTARLTLF